MTRKQIQLQVIQNSVAKAWTAIGDLILQGKRVIELHSSKTKIRMSKNIQGKKVQHFDSIKL